MDRSQINRPPPRGFVGPRFSQPQMSHTLRADAAPFGPEQPSYGYGYGYGQPRPTPQPWAQAMQPPWAQTASVRETQGPFAHQPPPLAGPPLPPAPASFARPQGAGGHLSPPPTIENDMLRRVSTDSDPCGDAMQYVQWAPLRELAMTLTTDGQYRRLSDETASRLNDVLASGVFPLFAKRWQAETNELLYALYERADKDAQLYRYADDFAAVCAHGHFELQKRQSALVRRAQQAHFTPFSLRR